MVHAVRPNLMLARSAQVHPDGTVAMLGGGLSVMPHTPTTVFIAGVIQIPLGWAGSQHTLRFELLDEQGPVLTGAGEPAFIEGQFLVSPMLGMPMGTAVNLPMAQPVTHGELTAGSRYEWRFLIDGEAHEDWSLGFVTMPEAQSKAA